MNKSNEFSPKDLNIIEVENKISRILELLRSEHNSTFATRFTAFLIAAFNDNIIQKDLFVPDVKCSKIFYTAFQTSKVKNIKEYIDILDLLKPSIIKFSESKISIYSIIFLTFEV